MITKLSEPVLVGLTCAAVVIVYGSPVRQLAGERGPRFNVAPPKDQDSPPYRGWTVWYDWGDFDHGICYRETKWRAQSPSGGVIEPPAGEVGSLAWLKAEIDRREVA